MIRAAIFAALLAGPVAAESPREVLDEITARLDIDEEGLGTDVYASQALARARAAGPLDPEWGLVMVTQAALIIEGLCKYERGMALLAEAEALALHHDDTAGADFARAWRAYHLARFGLTATADEIVAALPAPLASYITAERATATETLIATAPRPVQSPGVSHCSELLLNSTSLWQAGNAEGTRSLLIGLYLPPPLNDDPFIALLNASRGMSLWLAMIELGDRGAADAMALSVLAEVMEPGSSPPALRADLVAAVEYADLLHSTLRSLASPEAPDATREQARIWMAGLTVDSPFAREQELMFARDDALDQGDFGAALEAVVALAELPTNTPVDVVVWNAQVESYRAITAHQDGRSVDTDALAAAFRALYETEGVTSISRIDSSTLLVSAFDATDQGFLAHVAGVEVWTYTRILQEQNALSGDGVTGLSTLIKLPADIAIRRGFDVAARPPDGAPAPIGLCQELYELELCTIILAQP